MARSKQSFTLNGGTGTHIDAPAHFIAGGRTVEQLSTAELAGVPLAVIDCTVGGSGGGGAGEVPPPPADMLVERGVLEADERAHGRLPWGCLVCIRTGWAAERYEQPAEYLNAPDVDDLDPTTGPPHACLHSHARRDPTLSSTTHPHPSFPECLSGFALHAHLHTRPCAKPGQPRMHFPGISLGAAQFLIGERGAVGIGIDTLSPDG